MSTKKIALITGANKGIGLETARQLAKQGITVLAGARDEAKANAAAAELSKEGLDAHGIVIDVNEEGSIREAAARIERDYGRLDILVNNAGIFWTIGRRSRASSRSSSGAKRSRQIYSD